MGKSERGKLFIGIKVLGKTIFSLLFHGYRVSFPRVKRPERGVNHSPLFSAEVKEMVELYL